jgi:Bacterial Ig domain
MRRRWLTSSFVVGLLLLAPIGGIANATGPGGWDHLGHGATSSAPALNGAVNALNTQDPGMLLVGGSFTSAGGIAGTARIARWNGSSWHPVSPSTSPISNGAVNAIAYASGKVYVGGTFQNAGGNADADFLAVWNGSTWAPVCDGAVPLVSATVNALQLIGHTLYVGGAFADGGGLASADRLVACNLDTGVASSTVVDAAHEFNGAGIYALTADSNGVLYAGGGFSNLEGIAAADNVAYRDDAGWHAMGSGGGTCGCAVDDFVRSLTASGTNVYVGTDAKNVAGIAQADNVAHWNLSVWSALGADTAGTDGWFPASTSINGLATHGSTLYATGNFQNANGDAAADEVASYDGSAWHSMGSNGSGNGPLNARGFAAATYAGRVDVGGNFTSAGGDAQAQFLAVYPGYVPVCEPIRPVSATGGEPRTVPLTCSDKNGIAVREVIVARPAHGRVGAVSTAGKVQYTPDVGYVGQDSFSFQASNSDGSSAVTHVVIHDDHPGYGNAGTEVALGVGSLTPKPSGRLSFAVHNHNNFALHAVSVRITSRSKSSTRFGKNHSSVTVPAGRSARLTVDLSRAKLALLHRLGHAKVLVDVVLTGPHSSRTTASAKGTLHAP